MELHLYPGQCYLVFTQQHSGIVARPLQSMRGAAAVSCGEWSGCSGDDTSLEGSRSKLLHQRSHFNSL
jgi:hypothetical protein